uniref:Uncharacterized protein n=1 Tax=Setaria italica TaxID=4555 RepID=K3Y0F0_SETIT
MARGHAVSSVHPRVAGRAEVCSVGATVHHARRRAAPIARPGPWPTPFTTSNLLLQNAAAKIIIHERRDLSLALAPRWQFRSLSASK